MTYISKYLHIQRMAGRISLIVMVMILFVSCSGATNSIPPITKPAADTPAASLTSIPSYTHTMTFSPTATITPTIGPPPDLELINFTIVDSERRLLGEIRNNTDEAMVFPPGEPAFQFYFDVWDGYLHEVFGPTYSTPNVNDFWFMNCILYPGDTGVLLAGANCLYDKGCSHTVFEERTDGKTDSIVHMLSYQGLFSRWEDVAGNFPKNYSPLYEGFHPAVENLLYEIHDYGLKIEFDVNIQLPAHGGRFDPMTWIVLYDEQGRILNTLSSNLTLIEGVFKSNNYHVAGYGTNDCRNPKPGYECWNPAVPMPSEMIKEIKNIKVYFELISRQICSIGIYYPGT